MQNLTSLFRSPVGLSVLVGLLAFGATGVTLALAGLGAPFAVASTAAAAAAGLVHYAATRTSSPPDRSAELAAIAQLEAYRGYTAALRHDLRGVLSPALMMSDRLVNHEDKGVQRAGQAVVRSVERATALLATYKDNVAAGPPP